MTRPVFGELVPFLNLIRHLEENDIFASDDVWMRT